MPIPVSGKRIDINCTERSFPEFPDLFFGTTNDDSIYYFDASAYLQTKHLPHTIADFLQHWEMPIMAIANANQIEPIKICIKNTEGHYLIDSRFVYLFISFIHPDFFAFLMERMDELFSDGFCVSDTYLLHQTLRRIPPEAIIENDNAKD